MATHKKNDDEVRELHKQLNITSSKKVRMISTDRNTRIYGREY